MYLISQLWWYLTLAFLLGALIGYLLWRACGRKRLESQFDRARRDLTSRIHTLEGERSNFASAAVDSETGAARLKTELATHKSHEDALAAEAQKSAKDLAALRQSHDAEKATAKAMENKLASELAAARNLADETARKHADELKKARDHGAAELAAKHAVELKTAHELAKKHETQALALSDTGGKAKAELDAAKASHDAELKKARDDAATKHAAELANVRQTVAAEAAKHNADEVRKARDHASAEAAAKHADELKKAREHVAVELAAKHASELKAAHELAKKHETQVLALSDTASKSKAELEAAKARHEAELKKARDDAAAKHADELARTRATTLAEAETKHAGELAKVKATSAAELAAHKASMPKPAASAAAPMATSHAGPERLSGARGGTPDDLKLIWGVGPEIEKLLNAHGIFHFDQVAKWSRKDLDWLDANLHGFEGRAEREKWIEQAAKLATGWRPERDIGDKPANLLKTAKDGKPDDLKLIWGVGPKLEQMLNSHGIWHFSQIAAWTERELEWVDSQLGTFAGRAVRDKWIEQSGKLAKGWRPESDVGEKPQ